MTRSAPNSIATIDQFLATVGSVKTASEKNADSPLSEPGSIGGETSHPVKKVDDRLEKAKEGERSAENSKDVKEDQGAPSVENAKEASTKSAASIFKVANAFAKKAEGAVSTPGSAEDDHISSTLKVAPTGEDSANETNSAKAGKEDKEQGGMGGTKHPASTENDALDGHKYAADTPLEKLAADMRNIGNSLLASIHNVYQGNGVAPPAQTKTAAQVPQGQQKQAGDPQLAYFVGHELAGLINGTFDKKAADEMVHHTLTGVIKQASDEADMFCTYADHYFAKQAEGEAEDPAAGGGDPMAGGGGDPAAGGGGGGGEEEMMAALGGGAGGGDPMAGGGGGDPMGGGGGDEEAAQLAQILEQLGVTPEQLEQALAAQGGGGAGGAGGDPMGGGGMGGGDPMGGGGAPPPAPPGGGGGMPGMETQANAGGRKQNVGNTKVAAADIANHIREIVSRSRGRR